MVHCVYEWHRKLAKGWAKMDHLRLLTRRSQFLASLVPLSEKNVFENRRQNELRYESQGKNKTSAVHPDVSRCR